ncbi:inovirus-type Gp2 protein [Pseudomonas sp. FP1911]|uniref:YagK/YfjJ domain-containing protein n=1 Tax=Pseudomonas sp. FP1911 TaxID=2954081 RepID=UPI002733FA3C|nr:inovirus-type Gp2 protein [Pseudomonas sp. FP1911]WLG78936.1 inovirus-type Gp2 protein [Pseudomonas sp. FP1911]
MAFQENEIMDAYKEKVIETFYDPVKNEEYVYFGEDDMLFESVGRIMEAVSVIENNSGDIFGAPSFRYGRELVFSQRQESVLSAVLITYPEVERGMVLFKVNPYVRAFYECYMSVRPSNPYRAGYSELPECFDRLNRFVSAVRERISSSAFKREMSAHMRAANKNCSELLKYIDALFARYSRLLVLRIDFSYGKGKLEVEDFSEPRDRLSLLNLVSEKIVKHRAGLISYLKNKCPGLGMVGYVWKLEYGREKGHHYHMMFFLDGAKVRQDIVVAKRIGEYWNNVVTQGKGLYYNCNGDKNKYKYCGVGMINYSDAEALHNLKRAAVYLTKVDRYISACMPGNKRTFGKGGVPKASERSVGRPRQN